MQHRLRCIGIPGPGFASGRWPTLAPVNGFKGIDLHLSLRRIKLAGAHLR